jgi:putative PIN family toxin of toxin-antitoxin system
VRVVLDTNVLISALLFTGVSSDLVPLWQKGAVTILLSREILEEYLRVLAYPKFKLSRQEIRGLIEGDLLPFVEIVNPGRRRLKVVITDPSDDKFLECAVAGKADVLISGDKALLAIGRYRRVQIQNPSQFLDAFFG